jgi:sarcosine oxidase subunit beta
MSNTADVIIIGGGVQGSSLAFHLAQRGTKVIVLEKQFVGAGATGRSSGLVRMHYDTEVDSRLAWTSFQYFRSWKEMVGGESGFTRTGFVQLVAAKHVEALKKNTAMHQAVGIPSFLIRADDLKRLSPYMVTDDIELAAYEPESGYAMPSDVANSLMTAARDKNARLVQGCQVTGIQVSSGKITGVETNQGSFSAPVVVNAAGAWAGGINKMAGVDVPINTWKHDVMMVQRPKEIGPSHPTVIDFPNLMYFRPEGGLTLVGLEDNNPLGESPDGDADHADKGFVERAIDRICQRMPIMEKGALHSAHSGFDGITPDQHPVLGGIGPEGFYLDCGHSGTGFKTAPAVGLCMSELILDGAAKTVDISILSPHRFAEGRHIKGNYENIWS